MKINNFVRIYLNMIFTLFFVAVSMSCFVLIVLADQGIIFIVKNLLYPFFAFTVLLIWCVVGQLLLNQTSVLSNSLYDCNWMDAPLKFKKILLLFMLRSQRHLEIDAKPFYEANLFMFTNVGVKLCEVLVRHFYQMISFSS